MSAALLQQHTKYKASHFEHAQSPRGVLTCQCVCARLWMCMCVYVDVCAYICVHVCVCVWTCICTHACMHAYILCACMCVSMHVRMNVCMHHQNFQDAPRGSAIFVNKNQNCPHRSSMLFKILRTLRTGARFFSNLSQNL